MQFTLDTAGSFYNEEDKNKLERRSEMGIQRRDIIKRNADIVQREYRLPEIYATQGFNDIRIPWHWKKKKAKPDGVCLLFLFTPVLLLFNCFFLNLVIPFKDGHCDNWGALFVLAGIMWGFEMLIAMGIQDEIYDNKREKERHEEDQIKFYDKYCSKCTDINKDNCFQKKGWHLMCPLGNGRTGKADRHCCSDRWCSDSEIKRIEGLGDCH